MERFLNKTVTRQRKKSGTGSTVEDWEDKDTNLRCAIAPINPNETMAFQNVYFQTKITHTMFCLVDENILLDDKIIAGNDEYLIKKINKWRNFYQIYLSEIK